MIAFQAHTPHSRTLSSPQAYFSGEDDWKQCRQAQSEDLSTNVSRGCIVPELPSLSLLCTLRPVLHRAKAGSTGLWMDTDTAMAGTVLQGALGSHNLLW